MMGVKNKSNNFWIYFMEAAGLGGFVAIAGLTTIFVEHPELPPMQSVFRHYSLLRRIPLGVIMGVYMALVITWAGKKSGAHFNPAVTWTFYRLKKISGRNAVLYTVAQFLGAIIAAQVLKYTVGYWFSHPAINYSVTAPKPQYHSMTALIAESTISFLMMFVLLSAAGSKRLEKRVPLFSGLLIAVFLIFETPFSGMSMNPARSTAGDVAAFKFEHLWIYFVYPVVAMLMAAEVFLKRQKQKRTAEKKELPVYPLLEPVA